MACLALSLLGPFQVALDEQPVTGFTSNKVRALLAYLAVESGRPHRRDSLAALLWPDWPDTSARNNLRNALSTLRTALGDRDADPPYLFASRETLQFNPASEHWLDVTAFRAAVEAASTEREELEEALALYRGPFLEGFSIADSATYEEWALRVREELERLALSALERLAAGYEAQDEIERAIEATQRQVALAPWQESAHQALMRLLALDGQRSAALAQYEACRRLLAQELGVEPSAETVRLVQAIREERIGQREPVRGGEQEQSEATQRVPQHNLPHQATPFIGRETQVAEVRDFVARPEVRLLTLTGVGGTGKTRLALEVAAGQATEIRDGVLWIPLASLRDPALVVPTIAAALGVRESGDAPLLEACKRALRDQERLLVVDNFEQVLTDPEAGAAAAVSELLAAAPRVKVLATSRVPLHVYGEHEYPVLPMEVPQPHLFAPSGPGGAVRRSTTTEGLSLERVARMEAVSLFVGCAQRVRPDFCLDEGNAAAVAEICARLDGLPLAIELAAARVKLFSPQTMLAHLGERQGDRLHFLTGGARNAPARQRTLRAAIEWSYDLLSPDERVLFSRLSVFAGGCTLDAVQAVCADPSPVVGHADVGRWSSLDLLESLVDHSLLQVSSSSARFSMLETVREYAWERLQESGEAGAVRDRHAAHYTAALQAWEADLKGSRQLEALQEIESDLDNARAAWEWAIGGAHERVQADWLDRALDGLCLFYEWRGRYEEGRSACQRVVDCGTAYRPAVEGQEESVQDLVLGATPLQAETGSTGLAPEGALSESPGPADDDMQLRVMARALAWQSRLGRTLGQLKFADLCFERALTLLGEHRASGQDAERAFVLLCMAERARDTDLDRSRRLAERSLSLYRSLGDHWGMVRALLQLGSVANRQGAYEETKKWLEEGLALSRELGDRKGIQWSLLGMGYSAVHIGQLAEGERLAREAMAAARELGDADLVRSASIVLYTALYDGGRFAEAQAVREDDLAFCRDQGIHQEEGWAMTTLGAAVRHQGDYEKARALTQEALSLGLASKQRQLAAECTMHLGCLALAEGTYREAEEWLMQGIALYAESGRHRLMGELWATLAYLARARGRHAQARGHLLVALQIAVESRYRAAALQSLPAAALLLLDNGERGARAVELYALASRYPYVANSRWFEDVAGREIAAYTERGAAQALPPDVVAAAQKRGRARDLWTTVEELLSELSD